MTDFRKTDVISDEDWIAEAFTSARKEKNISLKRASEVCEIDIKNLEALERGEFSKLPAGVYAKKIIKDYADYLELDSEKIKEKFENLKIKNSAEQRSIFSVETVKRKNFLIWPKLIKSFLTLLALSVFFVYLGAYLKNIVSPPFLEITSPLKNEITEENFVYVEGEVEDEAEVTVNNKNVLTDSEGFFSVRVDLREGLNTITISAEKKYSRKNIIKRKIIVK